MQVLSKKTLRLFWEEHRATEGAMKAWFAVVKRADWTTPAAVRQTFNAADFVGDNRVIFNVGGNKYRIVGRVAFRHGRVMIKFVGTHRAYDQINPETV